MKGYLYLVILFYFIYIVNSLNNKLVDLNFNDKVIINGHNYFRFKPYANSTSSTLSDQYDYVPDFESNPWYTRKFTLKESITIRGFNFTDGTYGKSMLDYSDKFEPPYDGPGYTTDNKTLLIIPEGVTLTLDSDFFSVDSLVIRGSLILPSAPNFRNFYMGRVVLFPGSRLEIYQHSHLSNYSNGENEVLYFHQYLTPSNLNRDTLPADPLRTPHLICLACTFIIDGTPMEAQITKKPTWFGVYAYEEGYQPLRSGQFFNADESLFTSGNYSRLQAVDLSTGLGRVNQKSKLLKLNSTITRTASGLYRYTPAFKNSDQGYVLLRPAPATSSIILGPELLNTAPPTLSYLFYGDCTVNIKSVSFIDSVFQTDIGTPIFEPQLTLVPNTTNQYTLGANILRSDNLPQQYRLTFKHSNIPFTIEDCSFGLTPTPNKPIYPANLTLRAMVGIIRSHGTIKGNQFFSEYLTGFISVLWGTEVVTISGNAFVKSNEKDPVSFTPASDAFPNLDNAGSAIFSTSPFVTITKNAFEGVFSGGAIRLIPLQDRASLTGFVNETLFGFSTGAAYNYIQDNTDQARVNAQWNRPSGSISLNENAFLQNDIFLQYGNAQPTLYLKVSNSIFYAVTPNALRLQYDASTQGTLKNIEEVYDSNVIDFWNISPYMSNGFFNLTLTTGTTKAVSFSNNQHYATCDFLMNVNHRHDFLSFKNQTEGIGAPSTLGHLSFGYFGGQTYGENYQYTLGDNLYTKTAQPFAFHNIHTVNYTSSTPLVYAHDYAFAFILYEMLNCTCTTSIDGVAYPSVVRIMGNDVTVNNSMSPTFEESYILSAVEGTRQVSFSCESLLVRLSNRVTSAILTTITVDLGATNFYLGIDFTPYHDGYKVAVPAFSKNWTKCSWIPNSCSYSGLLQKVPSQASLTQELTGEVITNPSDIDIITSYLTYGAPNNSLSVFLNLPIGNFRFYFYLYNPSSNGLYLPVDQRYVLKINGKIQAPYTRVGPTTNKFHKIGPFYHHSYNVVDNITIELGSTGFPVQLSGMEILSDLTTPFQIPIDIQPTVQPVTTTSSTSTGDSSTSSSSTTDSSTSTTGPSSSTSTTGSTTTSTTSTTASSTSSTTGASTTRGSTTVQPTFSATTRQQSSSNTLVVNIVSLVILVVSSILLL